VLGFRVDSILSGLRPSLILRGFSGKIVWKPGSGILPDVSRGLRAFRYDGAFASISDNLAINFFEVYLVELGGGSREVGLMTSAANLLGFLSLWPGVLAVRRLGRRMPVVLWGGGGIGRLMYLALALVPFLFPSPALAVPAVIAFNCVRVLMSNFSNPAWTVMVADLVPERIRGPYFASRNSIVAVAGAAATFSSGWIVSAGDRLSLSPHFGYTLLFGLSCATGYLSTLWFSRVPDFGSSKPQARRKVGDLVREMVRYPAFVGFLCFTFLWNFSLYIAGPFFNVYLVRELRADAAMVGMVSMVGNIVQVFALPFWGRKVDAKGDLRILLATGFAIPLFPLAWTLVGAPWQVSIINVFSGFFWAGFNLANFNLLLKMMPEKDRQEGAALYQALVLASTILGPLVGAELVEALGYKSAFISSGLLRYAALSVLVVLVAAPLRRDRRLGA
jgi:MFS family permease